MSESDTSRFLPLKRLRHFCAPRVERTSAASRAALTDLFHDQVPRLARIPVSLKRSAAAA